MKIILEQARQTIFSLPSKSRIIISTVGALTCIGIVEPQALADDSKNFQNPIDGVERWKIVEANIDKIVGMRREQVHRLFGGVDSQQNGVSNRQKEVIQLDSKVALEIDFGSGLVQHPTFVKSELANRFWPLGESNDYVQAAASANTEDPRWPVMRDNLRNFMGMPRNKVEALLGTDIYKPKSPDYGQYAVGNRSLFFWYENGKVTRFDIDDYRPRRNTTSYFHLPTQRSFFHKVRPHPNHSTSNIQVAAKESVFIPCVP